MGMGTDIAIESSDLTLLSNDLRLVIEAIDLSKATLKNIYQNFLWAFSYNLIAIPLAATGHLSMTLAGAAMAFSSIMVVLNALRLKSFKFKYAVNKNKLLEKYVLSNIYPNKNEKLSVYIKERQIILLIL